MKNIIKETITFTIITLYLFYSIKYNSYIVLKVSNTIEIWINKIIPTLFPTLIIIDLIYNTKIPLYIEKYLHINSLYILSIISGSPTNAYILTNYNEDITKHLSVTKYTSPIFTYTFLKTIFNAKIALILMSLNILSNIILIILIKPKKLKYKYQPKETSTLITNSIKKTTNTLITILGTLIFFNTLPTNLIKNKYLKTLILSITEITTSLHNLSTTTLKINYKILFTIISLSTCGLCIETQIKSIISDTQINYNKYINYRLYHLLIYLILIIVITPIL